MKFQQQTRLSYPYSEPLRWYSLHMRSVVSLFRSHPPWRLNINPIMSWPDFLSSQTHMIKVSPGPLVVHWTAINAHSLWFIHEAIHVSMISWSHPGRLSLICWNSSDACRANSELCFGWPCVLEWCESKFYSFYHFSCPCKSYFAIFSAICASSNHIIPFCIQNSFQDAFLRLAQRIHWDSTVRTAKCFGTKCSAIQRKNHCDQASSCHFRLWWGCAECAGLHWVEE